MRRDLACHQQRTRNRQIVPPMLLYAQSKDLNNGAYGRYSITSRLIPAKDSDK